MEKREQRRNSATNVNTHAFPRSKLPLLAIHQATLPGDEQRSENLLSTSERVPGGDLLSLNLSNLKGSTDFQCSPISSPKPRKSGTVTEESSACSPLDAELNGLLDSFHSEDQGVLVLKNTPHAGNKGEHQVQGTQLAGPIRPKSQPAMSSGRRPGSQQMVLSNNGGPGGRRTNLVEFHPISARALKDYTLRKNESKRKALEQGKHLTSQEAFSQKMSQSRWLSSSSHTAEKRDHVKDCCCLKCRKLKARPASESHSFFFKMIGAESKLIRATLISHGFRPTQKIEKGSLVWSSHIIKGYTFKSFQSHQRVNQFPRSYECTRKDFLSHNFNRMKEIHSCRNYCFMPDCFVLPKERDALYEAMSKKACTWIVKPAGSACGRGIYLTTNFLKMPSMKEGNWIVSEYIDNPLLLDGRKFDLRIYVAVTSFNPLRIYVHEEGLCRLASHPYNNDPRLLKDQFIHLTNYSINKKNSNVSYNQEDSDAESTESKLSFMVLRQKLELLGVDYDQMWSNINDVIIKTLISIEEKVTPAVEQFVSHRNICFQLFGFDILIDDAHNPWLMEVNFAPSLNTDSPLDLRVKSKVISDLFNLAGVRNLASGPQRSVARNPYSVHMEPVMPEKLRTTVALKRPASKSERRRQVMTKEQRIVQETLEEGGRAGGFKRIFPSTTSFQYLKFFITKRPMNVLLAETILEMNMTG